MATIRSLRSDDVDALRGLIAHAARHDGPGARDGAYKAALRAMEEALSPAARAWWFGRPSDDLRAALARFVPAFRNVRTPRGWTAHRYIGRRGAYAVRPCATGLPEPMSGWVLA